MARNNLSSTIPESLAKLRHLRVLDLSNQISQGGQGIFGRLIDFSHNLELSQVYLPGNALSGTIPSYLFGRSPISTDLIIDLRGNSLTGTIPSELRRFDKINILLADNRIEAISDKFCYKSLWMMGDVDDFGCVSYEIICPRNSHMKYMST